MSDRPATEDQVVPNKKARTVYTYNPKLNVAKMTVDPDHDTYPETALGRFEVLQPVEHSGQGYYLLCKNMRLDGYFGPALVKYLGGKNEITRQFNDYSGVGVDKAVATEIRRAEDKKNPEREIKFASELVHKNIVSILGFISPYGKPDSINAIIMEGDLDGNLEAYASSNQIPLSVVKDFALQLASALEYCHSLGIMHRDVRARNIYVQQDKKAIKLGNFGYARVGHQSNIHTSNKGEEPYYRAPEMISGYAATEYTVSVDVYGFALVLWSILHGGRKPYNPDADADALKKRELKNLLNNDNMFKQHLVAGNRPRIDDSVDRELAKLIRECWINEAGLEKRPSMSSIVQTLERMKISSCGNYICNAINL